MTLEREAYVEALHAHVHAFFAEHEARSLSFDAGPIQGVVPGFHVIEVAPGPKLGLFTYISVGAGFPNNEAARHLEFLICSEDSSERQIELLAMTAFYHRTGERLDVGHTFPIGEPWLPGSTLDHMLVSLPYHLGEELEIVEMPPHRAHILWLLPITGAEKAHRFARGLEALEDRFEAKGLKYWKPRRKSVV